MDKIQFVKMSGSGNDFIVIDNRQNVLKKVTDLTSFITGVSRRRMSVGSDGLILVENSANADFKWHFYNSDGSRADMCGNGARCVSRFAFVEGIAGHKMTFESDAGIVSAVVTDDKVKIGLPDPSQLQMDQTIKTTQGEISFCSINTGVPHAVISVVEPDRIDVLKLGKEIRNHPHFAPAGTNVNFISPMADTRIALRTYERGVEDETLACGTGAVASALIMAKKSDMASPVTVVPMSGYDLTIYFKDNDGFFSQVVLEGDARIIYKGELWEDAWHDVESPVSSG